VSFKRQLASHGVASLPPQCIDEDRQTLLTTLAVGVGGAADVRIRPLSVEQVVIETVTRLTAGEKRRLMQIAREMLSLDENLSTFYSLVTADPDLSWAAARGAGRMLRSPTVFEDVVKTICTTNCAWSATVRMVTRIVELGDETAAGHRAFPSPEAMAEAGEAWYKEVARAGYRSPHLQRIAREVADGCLNLEALRDPELPDELVFTRLLALPGVGPYAAAHVMLTSLGRYRQLILDSWTRPKYARLTGRPTTDRTIERRFARYGNYAGLAFWLTLTRDWVDGDT
jgi:N-glycosylase/DNA lyase